jgi:nucleotide-binding universal stress UspA family protein
MSWFGIDSAVILEDLSVITRKAAERELHRFLIDCIPGVKVHSHILEGEAGSGIIKLAKSETVDIILMPTRGFGFFRRMLLGSVTAKVLHDSTLPVWTGTHIDSGRHANPDAIKTIVCAVNLGPQSWAILREASDLATAYGATLHLLHVLPTGPDCAWRSQAAILVRDQLKDLTEELGVDAHMDVSFGNAPANVLQMAHSVDADLLVIGRGCRYGDGRLPQEAYAIVRDAECPVLSV